MVPAAYPQKEVDSLLELNRYSAVIFGETHTDGFEPEIKLQLLEHLNERYNFRDVFIETGHALAWLFNQYLETGDTSFFHPLGNKSRFTPGYLWPGYRKNFWPQLYAYNKALPQEKRIIFHGTDFERKEALGALLMLIPDGKKIPANVEPVFSEIRSFIADTGWNDFSKTAAEKFDRVRSLFYANAADLRVIYESNYPIVARIIGNRAKQQPNWRPRNKTMGAVIEETVKNEHIEKALCFYGSAHTSYKDASSIPNKLDGLKAFRNRTLNIVTVYYNAWNDRTQHTIPFAGPRIRNGAFAALQDSFLAPDCRASLVSTAETGERSLKRYADFILFVNELQVQNSK